MPSEAIDWLVDRWQKTGSSRYADVWAAAYLGGRFFEMWARDARPDSSWTWPDWRRGRKGAPLPRVRSLKLTRNRAKFLTSVNH
ncbi:MAG: hypothetical protein R3D03_08785 [Geminicoccaceae bacterium]